MSAEEQAPRPQSAAAPTVGVSEISRRVASILDAVESEAARLREEARGEAAAYLEQARHRADELVAERQRRIEAISDELVARSEAVVARLEDAAPVQRGFESLVRALGDAAERLAREAEGTAADFRPPPFGAGAAHQPPPERTPGVEPPAMGVVRPPVTRAVPAPHPARAPAAPGWRGLGEPQAAARPAASGSGRDEARIVAIRMAASGSTRGGVREHLQRDLGVDPADAEPVLDAVFGPGSGEDARVPWTSSGR